MRVTVKLYATLGAWLPPGAVRNVAPFELPDGSSVAEAIERLGVPPGQVHLVLVNGQFVAPEARAGRRLAADDALALWPPVAGG
ncbi:sulfur carrier protein ThiS [Plasticicumulans lactativorans]|uniref:Sulfur carrier protein ThiS n=1 Tax=Plasticicumulans lactativorans TaxID=1133106 RepID=A0A4R2L8H9_9GAMM|nr:sulfur carrier protein ThiS [Plasticicumulans lactativorans]